MTIHLSGSREQLVLSLLQAGQFSSADEVIDEALRLVRERYQAAKTGKDADERTNQQLENLRRLGKELETLPSATIADGLSNRDHDQILYNK